ncbi:YebC/PmpR family DNA-binding transcriptional regulator [Oligella ureolytica]
MKSRSLHAAGGPDPDTNPPLRLAIDKATTNNMPKDNINRAIQRGAGAADGDDYEFARYEGYGLGGAAVIVDCTTDNRTRTVSDVRHALTKNGGNLGTDGSVTFMFDHVGQFLFAPEIDEDKIMEVALEAGAEDVITDEDGLTEVISAPTDFAQVRDAFIAAELAPELAEIIMKPQTEIELSGDDATKMQKIIDMLEDLDDVQKVYTDAIFDEEEAVQ